MPIHDWTQLGADRFHAFRHEWTMQIVRALHQDVMPKWSLACAEQVTVNPGLDILTPPPTRFSVNMRCIGGIALSDAPIKTLHQTQADAARYTEKADRVVIYHPDVGAVAVIEIVSPVHKSRARLIKMFANTAARYMAAGISLLIVDLFPPTIRDPQGIHKLIWDRIEEEPFELPADKPLTLAAYAAGGVIRAFVEPVGVGDSLPDMPIFLGPDHYVMCPLEATYQESCRVFPKLLKATREGSAAEGK